MNNYNFINPEFFYLLVIPLLYLIWYFYKRPNITSQIVFSSTDSLSNSTTLRTRLRHIPIIFKTLAACLLIIALAKERRKKTT